MDGPVRAETPPGAELARARACPLAPAGDRRQPRQPSRAGFSIGIPTMLPHSVQLPS
jgi:hypothetical protein